MGGCGCPKGAQAASSGRARETRRAESSLHSGGDAPRRRIPLLGATRPGHVTPPSAHGTPPSGRVTPPSGRVTPPSAHVTPPSGHVTPPSGPAVDAAAACCAPPHVREDAPPPRRIPSAGIPSAQIQSGRRVSGTRIHRDPTRMRSEAPSPMATPAVHEARRGRTVTSVGLDVRSQAAR